MASGSSSTNQAFVSEEEKAPGPSTDKPAAAAKEKQHWSGVARGAEFQKTVDQLGAKKDQSITVRLQRDESHGRSFSLEASFAWAPAAPQADCKQQLEQCVRGARGAVLVKEKLNPASKKEKQGTLSFKSSTQTPPPPPSLPLLPPSLPSGAPFLPGLPVTTVEVSPSPCIYAEATRACATRIASPTTTCTTVPG